MAGQPDHADARGLPARWSDWTLLETFEGDQLVRAEPFDALEPSLGVLWEG